MFSLMWWLLVFLAFGMLAPAVVITAGLLFAVANAPVRVSRGAINGFSRNSEPLPIKSSSNTAV